MAHDVFSARRARFLGMLKERDAVAVLFANPEQLRNGDVHHSYRQDSDLLYLTGFPEPGSACVLNPQADKPFVLFVRPKDREKEIWNGRRHGLEGAKEAFGADEAFDIAELEAKLPELCRPATHVVTMLGRDERTDRQIVDLVVRSRRGHQKEGKGPVHVLDHATMLHEMRLFKGPEEVAAMERAAAISAAAHVRAMEVGVPGAWEHEIQAAIEETFRKMGAARVGYGSIVAAGENATILHYVENNRRVQEGDLVLVDAGAEFDHYTADITRTFPASGSFSAAQRRLYDVVLAAQEAAIAEALPGRPWDRVHERARAVIIEGLRDLGLLSGSNEEIIEKKDDRRFYMHNTSHWLGMDVHDVGAYRVNGDPRPLQPGMVLTVEPGIYVHRDLEGVPAEYVGIGIRIEDDVLVTESGPRVLTSAAPKKVDEIVALLGQRLALSSV